MFRVLVPLLVFSACASADHGAQPSFHRSNVHGPQQSAYQPLTAYSQPSYTAPSYNSYEQPSYSAPTYEQPSYKAPTYEQPSYQAPTYEQPSYQAPTYEQPSYAAPTYEKPTYQAPTYEQPSYSAPTYEQPSYKAPTYEQPSYAAPTYEQPSYQAPSYEAPSSGYSPRHKRSASYEAPSYQSQSYGYNPPQTYAAPAPSYGSPAPSYGAPQQSYSAPQTYDAPQTYAQPSYGAPAPSYSPAPSYGAPQPSYGAPQTSYSVPSSYRYKRDTHGASSVNPAHSSSSGYGFLAAVSRGQGYSGGVQFAEAGNAASGQCGVATRLASSTSGSTCSGRGCRRSSVASGGYGQSTSGYGGEVQERTALYGSHPWQAALLKGADREFLCSAALINEWAVVTSASCVHSVGAGYLWVRLGDWDIKRDSEAEYGDDFESPAREVHIHSGFDPATRAYDVAVVTLKNPVNYAAYPYITPICLPGPGDADEVDYKSECYVAGWNKAPTTHVEYSTDVTVKHGYETQTYTYKRQEYRKVLQEAAVKAVERQWCQRELDAKFHGASAGATDCVFGKGADRACVADQGTAVVCVRRPSYGHQQGYGGYQQQQSGYGRGKRSANPEEATAEPEPEPESEPESEPEPEPESEPEPEPETTPEETRVRRDTGYATDGYASQTYDHVGYSAHQQPSAVVQQQATFRAGPSGSRSAKRQAQFVLQGIVSWTLECPANAVQPSAGYGKDDNPALYTNVAHVLDFINGVVGRGPGYGRSY